MAHTRMAARKEKRNVVGALRSNNPTSKSKPSATSAVRTSAIKSSSVRTSSVMTRARIVGDNQRQRILDLIQNKYKSNSVDNVDPNHKDKVDTSTNDDTCAKDDTSAKESNIEEPRNPSFSPSKRRKHSEMATGLIDTARRSSYPDTGMKLSLLTLDAAVIRRRSTAVTTPTHTINKSSAAPPQSLRRSRRLNDEPILSASVPKIQLPERRSNRQQRQESQNDTSNSSSPTLCNTNPSSPPSSSIRLRTRSITVIGNTLTPRASTSPTATLKSSPTLNSSRSPKLAFTNKNNINYCRNESPKDSTEPGQDDVVLQRIDVRRTPLESVSDRISGDLTETRSPISAQLSTEYETERALMSKEFSAGLEAARISMQEQFSAQLNATKTIMSQQFAAELKAARESMNWDVSAGLETALATLGDQLIHHLVKATRKSSGSRKEGDHDDDDDRSRICEEIVATQALVEGVHLRMAEIERSIRGLWATMAAERVDPMRALRNANETHFGRSKKRRRSRSRSPNRGKTFSQGSVHSEQEEESNAEEGEEEEVEERESEEEEDKDGTVLQADKESQEDEESENEHEADEAESEDAESEDAESEDAEIEDAESESAGSEDAESEDAHSEDAQSEDAQSEDAQSEDAESDKAEESDEEDDDEKEEEQTDDQDGNTDDDGKTALVPRLFRKRWTMFQWPKPSPTEASKAAKTIGTTTRTTNYAKDLDAVADQIASLYPQVTDDSLLLESLPQFRMQPRGSSLRSIWEEWFSATAATTAHDNDDTNPHHHHYYTNNLLQKPSIWSLNRLHRYWKRKCRPENVSSYWMKRVIVQEVMKEVAVMASEVGNGRRMRPVSLEDRVGRALEIVQRGINEAGSISSFYSDRHTRRDSTT